VVHWSRYGRVVPSPLLPKNGWLIGVPMYVVLVAVAIAVDRGVVLMEGTLVTVDPSLGAVVRPIARL
jgi:hypothetical protein